MGQKMRSDALHLMIERCAENRELIEVHAEDQADGVFYCGRIIEVGEAGFRQEFVDPLGVPGSKGALDAWFRFDEIGFIRRDTPYVRGLAKLATVHERFATLPEGRYRRKPKGIRKLMRKAAEDVAVVTLTVGGSSYNLLVHDADDAVVFGVHLEDDGTSLGEWAVRSDHIEQARRGSWEAAVEWLYHEAAASGR